MLGAAQNLLSTKAVQARMNLFPVLSKPPVLPFLHPGEGCATWRSKQVVKQPRNGLSHKLLLSPSRKYLV